MIEFYSFCFDMNFNILRNPLIIEIDSSEDLL